MAVNKGEIGIYGILRRDGGNNILAKTDQIQDDNLQKTQEQLNQEAINEAALATAHIANTNNPHNVTKAQVGLDKVTNDEQVKRTEMGKPLGVATLDGLGKVPSSQLPSYVDDVEEYAGIDNFPKYGESGKIYVETTTNLTYRWTGTQYIEISKSIGLGETESTAYPGDKGKQVTDSLDSHIKDTTNPHNVTKEQIGLGNVDNTSDIDKPVSTAQLQAISSVQDNLTSHINNKENPHKVTKAQIGLDKVDNTADSEKSVKSAESASKLETPVNIWGQSFDGSKDINGNLEVTGDIFTTTNYYASDGTIYAEPVTDTEVETMLNDLGI